jgi:hypothetical protein
VSEVLHLRAADARRVPWKNGRGFTSELALWPTGASFEKGDFAWRISKAAVEENGPFSRFPGFERVLVVTEGAGLALDHGGAAPRAKVERLVPYRFSGDWPTSAQLVDGRVADFNVLCRRGSARAEVEVWSGRVDRSVRAAQDEHLFLHLLSGSLEARTASHAHTWKLASAESLWLPPGAGKELDFAGTCCSVLVRITLAEHAAGAR